MTEHRFTDEELLDIAFGRRDKTPLGDPSAPDPCAGLKENVRAKCKVAGNDSKSCKDALRELAECMDGFY